MDPNLLPENFRQKEDKEQARLKKQPAGFDIELNLPRKERPDREAVGKPQSPGLWSGLFGTPARPTAPVRLTDPAASSGHAAAVDLLLPKKIGRKMKLAKRYRAKKASAAGRRGGSSWLSQLFGRPQSPIIGSAHDQLRPFAASGGSPFKAVPAASRVDWVKSEPPAAQEKARVKSGTGDSWGDILQGLFGYGRKKRIDFRLASGKAQAALNSPAAKEHYSSAAAQVSRQQLPAAAASQNREMEQKIEGKPHAGKQQLHAAPKREKAAEFSVNLMPQESLSGSEPDAAGLAKALAWAVIAPLIIITAGYGAVRLLQNNLLSAMADQQREFSELQRQIAVVAAAEKLNNQTADRVTAIKKLLDEKIIWNNFFDRLEERTLDGVYFNSLTADTSGALTLPGVADDYATLSRQLAALRDATGFIKEAKLINAELISEGRAGIIGVAFQVRLTLADGLFRKSAGPK